jgi:hypothetical protein
MGWNPTKLHLEAHKYTRETQADTVRFETKLSAMEDPEDNWPPELPDEEPSTELQNAAAAEAAAAEASSLTTDAIIAQKNRELKQSKKELRALTLETRRLLEEQRKQWDRESEEEGNRAIHALWNTDTRNDARAQQEQQRQSRQQQADQLKRDKQCRTSPAFLIHLISRISSVTGEGQRTKFRSFKLNLMAKIAKWADGKTFFKMDGQWVRIVQFEISSLMEGLTLLSDNFTYVSLNTTEAQTGASLAPLRRTQRTMQNGTQVAEQTPLPADRLIIVARDRIALDNARLVVDRFDEDGNIERVVVFNRRLVTEVKETKKHPMPTEVDELNPHGRPAQDTHNFTELLNAPAAGASAAPAVDATEDAVDATEDAVDATWSALEAQSEQPDQATVRVPVGLLRALSMNVGEASTTSVEDALPQEALRASITPGAKIFHRRYFLVIGLFPGHRIWCKINERQVQKEYQCLSQRRRRHPPIPREQRYCDFWAFLGVPEQELEQNHRQCLHCKQ